MTHDPYLRRRRVVEEFYGPPGEPLPEDLGSPPVPTLVGDDDLGDPDDEDLDDDSDLGDDEPEDDLDEDDRP